MPSASISSFADSFSQHWGQAQTMAQDMIGDRQGQMTGASAKAFLTGVVVLMLVFIVVARFAPEAYGQVNDSNITDVPGGSFFNSTGFLLVMLIITIALALKALDFI